MYSYEDRIRAVELYIKLGKRVRATTRPFAEIKHILHMPSTGVGAV